MNPVGTMLGTQDHLYLDSEEQSHLMVSKDGASAISGVAIPVGLQKKAPIKNGYSQALKSKGIFPTGFYTFRWVCDLFYLSSILLEWEVCLMPILSS